MTPWIRGAVLILASLATGCGTNPISPPPDSLPLPNPAPAGPQTPLEPSVAKLEIRDFTVTAVQARDGLYSYTPTLTLAETSGVSVAIIEDYVYFDILDVGPNTQREAVVADTVVPAGGTVRLAGEDPWGEP